MRFFLSLMLLVSVLALVGCGGGSAVTPETTTDSVTEIIKPLLERLAETGDLQGAEEVKPISRRIWPASMKPSPRR